MILNLSLDEMGIGKGYRMARYYEIDSSYTEQNHWYLGSPLYHGIELDARIFVDRCQPYHDDAPLTVPIVRPGPEAPVNFCDYSMVIVDTRVLDVIADLIAASVQRIPVQIPGARQTYAILNVIEAVVCVDETRSVFSRWSAADIAEMPARAQWYQTLDVLHILPKAVVGKHLFRVAGSEYRLIVSDTLKRRFDTLGIPDVWYTDVT